MPNAEGALKLSGFWTWDHSTNWSKDLNRVETGCFNPYPKSPESFVADYRALMEMMAADSLEILIIWGLFRDCHGGEASVRELLRVAADCGVKVLAGVGVGAYGGVYWEGDHPWNLATWLRRRPELAAEMASPYGDWPNAVGLEIACPSRDENVRWTCDGVRWLLEEFDVAGVNLETGDYGVCGCTACRAATAGRGAAGRGGRDLRFSFEDMARALPPVVDAALAARPDAIVTYATYAGFSAAMAAEAPGFVEAVDPRAICQWTLTGMFGSGAEEWPEGLRPPTRRSIGFSHWGSPWTGPVNTRHSLMLNHLAEACRRSAASGLEGLIIHGEVASRETLASTLNYRAFAHFVRRPDSTLDGFARGELAGLFGGEDEAAEAVALLASAGDIGATRDGIARCLRRAGSSSGEVADRWRAAAMQLFSRTL